MKTSNNNLQYTLVKVGLTIMVLQFLSRYIINQSKKRCNVEYNKHLKKHLKYSSKLRDS